MARSASGRASASVASRAAAVDDDDLVPGGAQRLQRGQRRDDPPRLVERGNDDRQAHARPRAAADQASAPPQLEPCPAVQP